MNKKMTLPLVGLIFFIALALRLYGISFGLPHLYHADEPIVVNHALAYGSLDFNPHFFRIPPLVSYLLFGVYGFFFLAGFLLGFFGNTQEFAIAYFADPTPFFLLARIIFGACLGALSVLVLFRSVSKHFSLLHGLLASLIFSTCLLHVRDSHFIYADIPLVFVLISFFGFMWKFNRGGEKPKFYYYVIGILIGIAGAIKYNGVFIAAPFLLYSWFNEERKSQALIGWGISAITSLFVFILLNPFALLDFDFFWKEINAESAVHQATHQFFHHLRYSLWHALGVPVLILALIGVVRSVFTRDLKRWSLVFFIALYYGVIYKWGQPYGRYVLPLLPFLIFFAADAVLKLTDSVKGSYRTALFAILIITCVFPSLMISLKLGSILSNRDTRTVVKEWVETNIPSGKGIALENEFYTPRLLMNEKQLNAKVSFLKESPHFSKQKKWKLKYWMKEAKEKPSYYLYSLKTDLSTVKPRFLFEKEPIRFSLDALEAKGVDYVIIYHHSKNDPKRLLQDSLAKKAELIYSVTPYSKSDTTWNSAHPLTGAPLHWSDIWARKRNGPPLLVYKLK